MTTPVDPNSIAPHEWRKSSFSGGGTGTECVQVAVIGDEIHVRDSKDPDGPVLRFTPGEARAFINGVKAGEFDDLGR